MLEFFHAPGELKIAAGAIVVQEIEAVFDIVADEVLDAEVRLNDGDGIVAQPGTELVHFRNGEFVRSPVTDLHCFVEILLERRASLFVDCLVACLARPGATDKGRQLELW